VTRLTNTAEGQANGTVATAANTGSTSGTAFTSTVIGTGCNIVFSTDTAGLGTKSYKFTNASGQANYLRWDSDAGNTTYFGCFVDQATIFSTATAFASFRSAAQSTMAELVLNTNGRLNLSIMGVTVYAMPSTFNNTFFLAGQQMWVECGLNHTTGAWTLRAIRPNGTVVINESGTASTLMTADIAAVRLGKVTASTDSATLYLDNFIFDTGKSSLEGLPTAPSSTPPSIAIAQASGYVKLTGTGTPGSGGAISYSISPSTGTFEPVDGTFFVQPGAYDITGTEAGSGLTDVEHVVVTAVATGGLERVKWNGTAWV
jgi:hypothetical protein